MIAENVESLLKRNQHTIMASGSMAQADIRSLLNSFPNSCIVRVSSYLPVKLTGMVILGQSVNTNDVMVHP